MTRDFAAFAAALYAPGGKGMDRLREAATAPNWPAERIAWLDASGIDACDRSYIPTERCVLEDLLVQLGSHEGEAAVPRLTRIASKHPQSTLRIRALYGLMAAGPKGIEAAAGPADETDSSTLTVRARATLRRGDRPDTLADASTTWKEAILYALQMGTRDRRRGEAPPLDDAWIAFVVDAYFDPALAKRAEAVLIDVPAARWKPEVAARKRQQKKSAPKKAKPTAAQLAELDAELTIMRSALERIVAELQRDGYAFQRTPLEAPPKRFATQLRKLEKRVGAVPVALARFWAIVGAVDLRGNHPAWKKKTWVTRGDEPHWYADPLVVVGLEGAMAMAMDDDFDVAEAPSSLRYALDLAGDDVTKANFSGGIISVEIPATELDLPLRGRDGSFLGMLRDSIAWRGFPGFAKIDDAPIQRT